MPILAKELATDTVRDNTTRQGIRIGRMSKGEMKAFQAAFVAADAGLDKKVCKNGSSDDDAKKCKADSTKGGLDKVYEGENGVVLAGKVSNGYGTG